MIPKQQVSVFCLDDGNLNPETLWHVTFDCGAYAALRRPPGVASILQTREEAIFAHHRDCWSWGQLRLIRSYFCEVISRRSGLAGGTGKRAAIALQQRAERLWPPAEIKRAAPQE